MAYSLSQNIVGGLKQRNGCGIPSTFFVTVASENPPAAPHARRASRGACARGQAIACPPLRQGSRHALALGMALLVLAHKTLASHLPSPTSADTIPAAVQALYLQGNEIATHTVTHPSYPSPQEIVGCRDWLVNNTGIPAEKLVGFRWAHS